MVAVTRKSQMGAKLEVNPAAVADVLKVLARHNPGLSKQALAATGKVMAVVSAVAARLLSSNSVGLPTTKRNSPILSKPPSPNWLRSQVMCSRRYRSKSLWRSAEVLVWVNR